MVFCLKRWPFSGFIFTVPTGPHQNLALLSFLPTCITQPLTHPIHFYSENRCSLFFRNTVKTAHYHMMPTPKNRIGIKSKQPWNSKISNLRNNLYNNFCIWICLYILFFHLLSWKKEQSSSCHPKLCLFITLDES